MSAVEMLVTSGGPHPPDKWAILTGNKIVSLIAIDETSSSPESSAARKSKPRLAIDIADAIENLFAESADHERDGVNTGAISKRNAPFSVDNYVDSALSIIEDISKKSAFPDLFKSDQAKIITRNILKQNFIDAANVARSWAFDAKGL